MRRLAILVGALTIALLAPLTAKAHPLGNFTVNRYSELVASGDRLYVVYVLDLAEIPTFQAERAGGIDAAAYARRIGTKLDLRADGRRVPLVPIRRRLSFPAGAGGLHTARLEVVLRGPALSKRTHVTYQDRNYADRIGWKEIVVRAERGAAIDGSTAPARSSSDQLRTYPKNLLKSPLDVTEAAGTLVGGSSPGAAPQLDEPPPDRVTYRTADHGFAALIGRGDLSLLVVLGSLGLALFWGAAHALSPGHGKAIVAGYLIGQRGTSRHALWLGLIVTITHTISVFALGLVTLLLSQFIVPDRLYPWLNVVAGLLVVGVGASVLWARARHRLAHAREHDHHHHDHHHAPDDLSRRSLLAVGISGGLLPCPSALVVLLAAISLHRVGFGLLLIVAFSIGLAATISAIGLVAVCAKRVFTRTSLDGRLVRLLPAASALAILIAGVVMTARAVPSLS
jgi:ABC-type nickel/cobalt efflux system permease component RcnA